MKLPYYALAGVRYYKKDSVIIALFFTVFLFMLTLLFDLRQSIQLLRQQINENFTDYENLIGKPLSSSYFNHITQAYANGIVIISSAFCIAAVLLLFLLFKKREVEFVNWRLLGFSTRKIWLLMFLEVLIPSLIASSLLFLLLIVSQHFYESALQTINYRMIQLLGKPVSTATKTITSVPGSSVSLTFPAGTNQLFVIDFTNGFSLLTVLKSLMKGLGLLISSIVLAVSLWQLHSLHILHRK